MEMIPMEMIPRMRVVAAQESRGLSALRGPFIDARWTFSFVCFFSRYHTRLPPPRPRTACPARGLGRPALAQKYVKP